MAAKTNTIEGKVERVVYANQELDFIVLKVKVKALRDLATITSAWNHIKAGEQIEATGEWTAHNKYGKQFQAQQITITRPSDLEGIRKYLASGIIKDIGSYYAKQIVDTFGVRTLEVIEQNPEALLAIEGIGKGRMESIRQNWQEQKIIQEIIIFLQTHNLSPSKALKIYRTYGQDALVKITTNPYLLVTDIKGLGFTTADQIALGLGIAPDSDFRIKAGLHYTLLEAANQGHTILPVDALIKQLEKLLDLSVGILTEAIQILITEQDLFSITTLNDQPAIGLSLYYNLERKMAQKLCNMISTTVSIPMEFDKKIQDCGQSLNLTLDESQIKAVQRIILDNLIIITGGPGTGKTTLLKVAVKLLEEYGFTITLCAPTGRAAKRMSESTGLEAKTIHRLLAMGHGNKPEYHNEHRLGIDILVLDEASMVNISLMYSLISALPDNCKLIIIGDVDQLPPIGAGQVLKDMIDSNVVPYVRLSKIFRQNDTSNIILNAHRINQGIEPVLAHLEDFWFIEEEHNIEHTIVKLVSETLKSKFDILREVQILSPIQAGLVGVRNLNMLMQQALLPEDTIQVSKHGEKFLLGDKVMQLLNNYDKDVFNGDIGIIRQINLENQSLKIEIGERLVEYQFNELDQLSLAYASTVHKAQGSEYPVIIIPVSVTHKFALRKRLLYTAVTRAKQLVILVGQKQAIRYAVTSNIDFERYCKLKDHLIARSDF